MKDRGTLIKRSPLTETSFIVHWCCHEQGIIKTVAKGARRAKSAFAGKLDLFFLCEVEIHPAKKGDLHILKDLAIDRARLGLRRTYLQTLVASYFVKLIEGAAEPQTPIPELADLLDRGLNYLEESDANFPALRHFEKQLCQILGVHEPETDAIRSLESVLNAIPGQRDEIVSLLSQRQETVEKRWNEKL